jgi:hypothetical protein
MLPGVASAQQPPAATAAAPASPPPPAPAPPAATAPSGVGVVAVAGATDAAWPLAQAVYGTPALRPAGIDEAHARVLCGEPPASGAPADLKDLADSVAAVRGEDAPSRMILGEIAHRFAVRALVVVHLDAGRPAARVFLPDSGAFDAATYAPDATPANAWTATTQSLARTFGPPAAPAPAAAPPAAATPPPSSAPPLALHAEPVVDNTPPKGKAFYESGWFWGALGAAAFAGAAVFLATRDNGPTTIHLEAQVPH